MTPELLSTSAALRFTEEELGGPCTEIETTFLNFSANTVIAQGNGDRVGLIIMNIGNTVANVGLLGAPNANNSLQLQAGGSIISLNVRDDFTLPSRQWSASGSLGPVTLYVLEIIRFKAGVYLQP